MLYILLLPALANHCDQVLIVLIFGWHRVGKASQLLPRSLPVARVAKDSEVLNLRVDELLLYVGRVPVDEEMEIMQHRRGTLNIRKSPQ